ncbi:hypothetical protein [Streptomyces sp. NPDC002994]|uniref:hypothetical protein n=1 Tax=Streptomyces sp. NPDC002994 TaxID=3154441 RepID=UPI0033B38E0C
MISIANAACMRSTSLLKPALMAALACIALSGCASHKAIADHAPANSATQAATPPDASSIDNHPELRFLELMTRITQSCAPDAPQGGANGEPPRPEDLPGWEGSSTPSYVPGQAPPSADGGNPVTLPPDAPAPPESTPSHAMPKSVKEVPLTGIEKCSGDEHAKRISEAFKNKKATSYQVTEKKLIGLNYPASRIHQMPNHAGAPRARLDLRMMGSHLALEVTGTSSGVTVETFGAPETEDVKVTDVKRKPKLAPPTS